MIANITPEMMTAITTASPSVLMVLAIVFLWKYIAQKDAEAIERGKTRDARITHLETSLDNHAIQYRELAERVATVVGQTKDVMERVLDKLK